MRETKDILDHKGKRLSWGKFYSKKKLGLKYNLRGFLSDYSEGGYSIFMGIETDSLENVLKKFTPMMNSWSFYLQNNTLAANFVFSGYILDMGKQVES